MPRLGFRIFFVVTVTLLCVATPAHAADALPFLQQRPPGFTACDGPDQPGTSGDESVTCYKPRANTEVWAISRPNVKQKETTYGNIQFRSGDLVHVMAGGCVQTGGGGLTWKRYVNPMDRVKGDDDTYYGLVMIPGAFPKGRIRDAVRASPLAVLQDPGSDRSLRLGYADDDYGDNGYWGHDWGWWEQCRDSSDAFVVIAIQHGCASAPQSADCSRLAPLDLMADSLDPNGFAENPQWGWQRLTGTRTPAWQLCGLNPKSGGMPEDDLGLCTRQLIEKDTYWACARDQTSGRIEGHANWADSPVTYHGTLFWDDHGGGDDDYTLNLTRDDQSLFTFDHWLQIEFDSDETVDRFTSPWWSKFHGLVDQEDQQKGSLGPVRHFAGDAFGGKAEAIVIGQLGLDCVHACDPEIHPVWAIAIHVKPARKDDLWAFFVRNWGDEGFCGRGDHRLGAQTLTFRLPFPGASHVEQTGDTKIDATAAISPVTVVTAPEGGAALVTFTLPDSSQHVIIGGDLHLNWTSTLSASALADRKPFNAGFSAATRAGKHVVTAESAADTLWSKLGPDRRATLRSRLKSKEPLKTFPVQVRSVQSPPPPPPNTAVAPRVTRVDDAVFATRKDTRSKTIEELSKHH